MGQASVSQTPVVIWPGHQFCVVFFLPRKVWDATYVARCVLCLGDLNHKHCSLVVLGSARSRRLQMWSVVQVCLLVHRWLFLLGQKFDTAKHPSSVRLGLLCNYFVNFHSFAGARVWGQGGERECVRTLEALIWVCVLEALILAPPHLCPCRLRTS